MAKMNDVQARAFFKQQREQAGMTRDTRNPALIAAEQAFKDSMTSPLQKKWAQAKEANALGALQQAVETHAREEQQRQSSGGAYWNPTPTLEEQGDGEGEAFS